MDNNIQIETINRKAKIYQYMPPYIRDHANTIRKIPTFLNWYFHPEGKNHTAKVLEPFQEKFQNHRCIVIGNGPSLNHMDLSILKNEYTFGLNRIYLLFEKLGFETTFFVCSNGLVQTQFEREISQINATKFLNWDYRKPYTVDEKTAFLCPRLSQKKMDGHLLKGYFPTYGTVTNIALQLAFFMGFSEVIIIGVDHNYAEQGSPGEAIVSKTEDPNHFSKDYFGPGTIWQLPNYVTMEIGYRAAKEMFESDSRVIVDATYQGKLNVFKKVDFYQYLQSSTYQKKE